MIGTKKQMYDLLKTGQLGNRFRLWMDVESYVRSGFRGLVGVRGSAKPNAPYWHHLTPQQGLIAVSLFEAMGHKPIIYEASPDQHITIQGEFAWLKMVESGAYGFDRPHFWLRYSTAQTHMRAALETSEYADGERGERFLRGVVGQEAWSEFVWMGMCYPEHIIEFTAYDCRLGVENKHYVCWEVRAY